MLEQRRMEKLYEIASLDPETIEGQIRIDPQLLIKKSTDKQEPIKDTGFFSYLNSFFNFSS